MAIPSLFRWLSKKYPKIIYPVVEEEDIAVPAEDGGTILIPVDMALISKRRRFYIALYRPRRPHSRV
ncbi:hypothetical protein C8J57DRAFT_574088 [Mycena rebaudengoi]|nr:hypothetical protein C8J57DRAFT_574088 [Mycena rebaudengoi]